MSDLTNDPDRFARSRAGAEVRRQACQPSSAVCVGLLVNRNARRLASSRARGRLLRLLPDDGVEMTQDLASLRRALARLLCARRCNVLAIAGGDGTVHHAVNALLALGQETRDALGAAPPLPRILILNGGTLNIVGRTMAVHGPAHATLRRFVRAFDGARLSRVPARRLPMMAVHRADMPARHGFVFGSEVLHHAIELYTRFGSGYSGLLRFLVELSRGALTGSELWQAESWKLGPFGLPLSVDGDRFDDYAAVVASTVDLTLAVASVRAIRRPLLAPGFHAKVITQTDPRRILALIPALASEGARDGIVDHPNASTMRLFGPFTLDGELFGEASLRRERLPLTVQVLEQRLHAVPGEFGARDW